MSWKQTPAGIAKVQLSGPVEMGWTRNPHGLHPIKFWRGLINPASWFATVSNFTSASNVPPLITGTSCLFVTRDASTLHLSPDLAAVHVTPTCFHFPPPCVSFPFHPPTSTAVKIFTVTVLFPFFFTSDWLVPVFHLMNLTWPKFSHIFTLYWILVSMDVAFICFDERFYGLAFNEVSGLFLF